MKKIDFKALLGLERSVSLSNAEQMTDSQLAVAKQVEGFGIDEIYFSKVFNLIEFSKSQYFTGGYFLFSPNTLS